MSLTVVFFCLAVVLSIIPILYTALNIRRIRRTYILSETDRIPLARDPFMLVWAAITLVFTQVGISLVLLSFVGLLQTGHNYQPVAALGTFVCVGSLLGFLLASCEVSWEKEKGRSSLLWRDLHDAYYFLLYANPVGISRLMYVGLRKFFLPYRA